jgi:hypothetical protein
MTNRAEFERLLDVYGFRCERFGQDLSTHARAQVVSAFAALASAPVAGEAAANPLRDLTEDERAAIEFYTLNPTAAVRDLDKRLFGHPAPQASEAVRLDAPAQIGGVRFGKGIHWSTVIAAAQRHHTFMNTPEKEAERIARAKEFVESIQADKDGAVDESPNLQGLPVDRSADLQGGGDCAKGAGDELAAQKQESRVGTNSGHGHVWDRPDGMVTKCGGPGICIMCTDDKAHAEQHSAAQKQGGSDA